MSTLDGDGWRALSPDGTDAGAAAALADRSRVEGRPAVVAVTGGVGAGKSTFAAAVADRLEGAVVVGSDGFLLSNAELARRGLTERKGFPESFDTDALARFLDAVRAGGPAVAPRYSHLAYDVVPGDAVDVEGARTVVVEGLHLRREHADLLVHLDADDADLRRWYLARFRELRTMAAAEPDAFLHPYLAMGDDALDAVALDVWDRVNLVVLHEHVRPARRDADVALDLGPDHLVARATLRDGLLDG